VGWPHGSFLSFKWPVNAVSSTWPSTVAGKEMLVSKYQIYVVPYVC